MEKVFVGGEPVWDGGKPVDARPGKVLISGRAPTASSGSSPDARAAATSAMR
jgi:hypothetical protein